MSNDPEELGYTKEPVQQSELFGDIPADETKRIKFPEKLAELERELKLRGNVYPGLVDRNKLTQERADRQIEVLRSIIDDYNVRPWPQTKQFVAEWREDAETITFMNVPIARLHREELLAIVAYCKTALEKK